MALGTEGDMMARQQMNFLRDDELAPEYNRTAEFERGVIDMETGEFPATLATQREASDGHIISIKGLKVPRRMPMLLGHVSSGDVPALGSVVTPTKVNDELKVTGRVNLNGDDILAGVRRGIAQLIADGDLNQMSLRWIGHKVVRRTNLPGDHFAFIDAALVEDDRRWGLFFQTSSAKEGSVVAVGADPAAVMGRAQAAGSGVDGQVERAYFTHLTRAIEQAADGLGDLAATFAALCRDAELLRTGGIDDAAMYAALGLNEQQDEEWRQVQAAGKQYWIPAAVFDELRDESLQEYRSAVALRHDFASEVDSEEDRQALIVLGKLMDANDAREDEIQLHSEPSPADDDETQVDGSATAARSTQRTPNQSEHQVTRNTVGSTSVADFTGMLERALSSVSKDVVSSVTLGRPRNVRPSIRPS